MPRYTALIVVCLVMAVSVLASGSERQARHDAQLVGLGISGRSATTPVALSPVATNAGPDVQISEVTSPAMFTQDNVSLARTKDFAWLAVWQDNRLGAEKIYLQQFDSIGASVGVNRLMASSQTGADYVEPKLAVDTSGRVYLFWRDATNGLLYGSRYNSDLTVDLAPFLVNDTSTGAFAGLFDFDVYPDGRLVVVWENYAISGSSIVMRIYGPAGTSLLGPSQVNTDVGAVQHWSPDVAVQQGSGFLVAWEDYRSGNADVMARLFTGAGAGVAPEFGIVPPGAADSAQYEPQVVYSSIEKYVIGWIDRRAGQEMYLQRYDPVTGLVGNNVVISSGDILLENWDLDLTVSPDGRVLATWGEYGPQAAIMARRFNAGLAPTGAPIVQNQLSIGQRWAPSAEFLNLASYGIAWTESQSHDRDVVFMLFDTTGARRLAFEKQLNDDTQGAPAAEPFIAPVTNWYDLVAFTSTRSDQGDIYVQLVSHAGQAVGNNRKLHLDVGTSLQNQPSIAVGRDTNFVVWVDSRAMQGISGQRVFGRFVNDFGTPFGPEIVVSDVVSGIYVAQPRAAISTNGRILVTWVDYRVSGETHVRGRWLTSAGELDGAEFVVSDQGTDYAADDLWMGTDAAGRLYVVWNAATQAGSFVDGTWYDANKNLGGSFSYAPASPINRLAADVNEAGTIAIVFNVSDANARRLYAAAIDRTGTPLIAPMEVKQDTLSLAESFDAAIDDQGYISAVWATGSTAFRRVYYQIFSNAGTPVGGNQLVSSSAPEYMKTPTAAAKYGRLWVAWVDPRSNGDNVWGNVVLYLPTDVDDDDSPLPSSFSLSQNYPNPFNPSTEIRFSLPERAEVTLEVFNLLGQRVSLLASGMYGAGEYRVTWEAPVAAGVYFYRLTAGEFSQTRKMVVVK